MRGGAVAIHQYLCVVAGGFSFRKPSSLSYRIADLQGDALTKAASELLCDLNSCMTDASAYPT